VDYYGTQQQDACPRCGSTANVRTVQDLVDMYGQMMDNARQRRDQYQQGGYRSQPGGYGPEPFYGPESGYGPAPRSASGWPDSGADSIEGAIADVALGAAARFIGRAIGKKVRQTYSERIAPNLEARYEQNRQEQIAIAQRYPDLRACLQDQVIFLADGTRTVPLSEISPQVTLAQADAIVARLREP